VIGIQARSTSKRLPAKVFEPLGKKSVLRHVIDACYGSSLYINNYGTKKIWVDVALCVPDGDPMKGRFSDQMPLVEGPEHDVLARYLKLLSEFKADYVVRITGDCPLIPSFVISKCITVAVMNQYDYLSNVDERVRTTMDGWDCEVISKRLLEYVGDTATDTYDREHVTTFIRSHPPDWIKQGMIINFLDLSHLKLSVDTEEDLERVRAEHGKIEGALERAEQIFGKRNVHRL
jgi:spore coat polysaccharide biosynthesis protein SpsF (cytidylyltransferase family)